MKGLRSKIKLVEKELDKFYDSIAVEMLDEDTELDSCHRSWNNLKKRTNKRFESMKESKSKKKLDDLFWECIEDIYNYYSKAKAISGLIEIARKL